MLAPEIAIALTQMMERVVREGTGRAARLAGVRVAGKTGTAENPHGPPHAWFTCFAPVEHPSIVVTVIVENGGVGGSIAAPIARRLLQVAERAGYW